MSRTKWTRFARVALAGAAAAAFAATAFTPVTAQAAETSVNDVTLTWGVNAESGGGSFFGGCNFLSAGVAGNSGSSRVWTEADGFYKSTEGNVTIIKDGANGAETPTWDTKCLTGTGAPATPGGTSTTNNKAVLSAGTGTVDVEAGTASIAWDGSFSIVYYGGLTYWSVTDPVLTVNADGTANLKATASGYAASQDGEAAWGPLPSATVTLANFTGIEVTESGFEATPLYREVEVSGEGVNQVREGANWGAFPQDMVTFNTGTGQAAYWYSSGGSADPKKVAGPLSVAWEVEEVEEPIPTPEPTEPGESEDHEVDVEVVVPEPATPEPGKFEISIAGNANMGEAEVTGAGFVATGALPNITVTDTREDTAGWSVNGVLADFVGDTGGTIMASSLGWTPTSTSDDVQLGAANNPHRPGLVASSLLAQGGAGEHVLSADLKLHALGSTIPGEYTAKRTLTVVS